MEFQAILVETDGPLGLLTLNKPDRHNALDEHLIGEITEGLRQHTERRLQFALSWANHDIRSVSVDLSDVNGARGGPGKRCRIQIPLPRVQPVVIEEVETDLYVAIDRAADRSERTVARRLERLREHRHARPQMAEGADATIAH